MQKRIHCRKTVREVAEKIRENTRMRWLASEDAQHDELSQAYEEYLSSQGVSSSVGQGRVLLGVYEGEPLVFQGAEGTMVHLKKNSVLGHIISKRTDVTSPRVIAEALESREMGARPKDVYKKLRQEMPLNWNLIDNLPEAPKNSDAVGFLAYVNVHPSLRRIGLSRPLIRTALKRFLDEDNIDYAFALARAPSFPQSGQTDIQEYVLEKDSSGRHPRDPGIRIHQSAGQTVLCGIPYGAIDSASKGFSVLVASNIKKLFSGESSENRAPKAVHTPHSMTPNLTPITPFRVDYLQMQHGVKSYLLEQKQEFAESYNTYVQELGDLASKITRSDGRPLLTGLGLYPGMGADPAPLYYARNYGMLVGMSLHESELLVAAGVLEAAGLDPGMVFGGFRGYGKTPRNLAKEELKLLGGGLTELLSRAGKSRRRIGSEIGERDWLRWGRSLFWDNFTFLPSVSGDEEALESFLGEDKRFDYLILKGQLDYRFSPGAGGRRGAPLLDEYLKWLRVLDERFLSGDAVVLAARTEPVGETLSGMGYERIPTTPLRELSQEAATIYVNAPGSREISSARIHSGAGYLSLSPNGGFTVYEKQG